jgi:hypothetical protein
MMIAPIRYLLVKMPISKRDRLRERMLKGVEDLEHGNGINAIIRARSTTSPSFRIELQTSKHGFRRSFLIHLFSSIRGLVEGRHIFLLRAERNLVDARVFAFPLKFPHYLRLGLNLVA